MLKIDSHHHLWRFNPDEYSWLVDPIRRDFLPADLQRELSSASIDAAITVQARQTLEETRWLLELAAQNDFIKGVVGWVPLIAPNIAATLEQFSAHPKLRAVRHVLHDEPDDNYILRPDFNRGISLLAHHKLAYDILIFERHLPQTIRFVDQHPNQIFVLDHLAKPRLKLNEISPWRENISELAKRPNVSCKLSGLATEADHANWTTAQLRPYMDTVLDAFGPKRLMFGSDWPVCLLAVTYQRWAEIVQAFIAQLSTTEQQRIWSETALAAYNLPAAKQ
jgi:L-fuconolactonase